MRTVQAPRSFARLFSVLVLGTVLVLLFARLSRPREKPVGLSTPATSNTVSSGSRTVTTSRNRVRKPKVATIEVPEPGTARLAAFQALASVEEEQTTPELRSFLDQTAVPALSNLALGGGDLSERLQAVMVLLQVNTTASQSALQTLRRTVTDEMVQRALRGSN